ncbi:hypothetical protein [Alkalihalobacillus sp. 1P02AB]|uniref:hypothetical protein n=1 Tax=Alkalihalobacillus sp. 1P02AB TaxID=3132260 RepID=UPI0039A7809B
MRKWWRNEQGLSIIELLAALTLITLIFGGATYVIFQQNIAQDTFQQGVSERIELQAGIAEMKRNIENASELTKDGEVLIVINGERAIAYKIEEGTLIQNEESTSKVLLNQAYSIDLINNNLVEVTVNESEEPIQMTKRKMTVVLPVEEEDDDGGEIVLPPINGTIICKDGIVDFSGNAEMSAAYVRGDLSCNPTSGVITLNWSKNLTIHNATLEIITNDIKINGANTFEVKNGSIITEANIDITHHSNMYVSDWLHTSGEITLHSENSNLSAENLYATDLTLDSALHVNINNSLTISNKLKLLATNSSITANEITVGSAEIRDKGTLTSNNDLTIKEVLTLKEDASLNSGASIYIGGQTTIKFRGKINSTKDLIIKDSIKLANEASLNSRASIYIGGQATIEFQGEINSTTDIFLTEKLTLYQSSRLLSKGNLYAKQGLEIHPMTTIEVKSDAYINREIKLVPENNWMGNTTFMVDGQLTYITIVNDVFTPRIINAGQFNQVEHLNLDPYFPSFP